MLGAGVDERSDFAGIFALPLKCSKRFGDRGFAKNQPLRGLKRIAIANARRLCRRERGSMAASDIEHDRPDSRKEAGPLAGPTYGWLLRPVDRRISIPISRQTHYASNPANMASIFTLGVGFCSAYSSPWADTGTRCSRSFSVYCEHPGRCDGGSRSLELLESDFGCWLETSATMCFTFPFGWNDHRTVEKFRYEGKLAMGRPASPGAGASFLAGGVAATSPSQPGALSSY